MFTMPFIALSLRHVAPFSQCRISLLRVTGAFILRWMENVTQILNALEQGDSNAAEHLLPLVYGELRRLAAQLLSHESPHQTLQPTALVHEAYVRLVGTESERPWDSRGHFFAAAAEAMRRILVENARRKKRQRHGGNCQRVPLDESALVAPDPGTDVEALDEALDRLEAVDPQAAQLVKLRFFAGLTMPEAAAALAMPLRTAERNWTYARTWLHRTLSEGDRTGP
jgi:RNA polymerase sigma factor (TIGR02999 family)